MRRKLRDRLLARGWFKPCLYTNFDVRIPNAGSISNRYPAHILATPDMSIPNIADYAQRNLFRFPLRDRHGVRVCLDGITASSSK